MLLNSKIRYLLLAALLSLPIQADRHPRSLGEDHAALKARQRKRAEFALAADGSIEADVQPGAGAQTAQQRVPIAAPTPTTQAVPQTVIVTVTPTITTTKALPTTTSTETPTTSSSTSSIETLSTSDSPSSTLTSTSEEPTQATATAASSGGGVFGAFKPQSKYFAVAITISVIAGVLVLMLLIGLAQYFTRRSARSHARMENIKKSLAGFSPGFRGSVSSFESGDNHKSPEDERALLRSAAFGAPRRPEMTAATPNQVTFQPPVPRIPDQYRQNPGSFADMSTPTMPKRVYGSMRTAGSRSNDWEAQFY